MRYKSVPYHVDAERYERFDERENIFGRLLNEKDGPFYHRSMYANAAHVIARDVHGYSRVEFAKALASWTVYDYFHEGFSAKKLANANSVMEKPALPRLPIDDPDRIKRELKGAAEEYGADLVGIAQRDDRWIYSRDITGKTMSIPSVFKTVIVMGIAMDVEAIKRSPAFNACSATGIGYSKMAFCIACVAEFIRYLGYQAVPMGNDTALSIPLAIDAGLGELGRNGLLITREYGPCVRLCKVFTDLPLTADKPDAFGVAEYCRECRKCADACEAGAIQRESKPSFKVVCRSNNKGIQRWAVNHDRCYQFWIENAGDCSNCIAACPFLQSED